MQDGMFRRAKPQLRKKRESSSDEEADLKKSNVAGNPSKKPTIQKGLQIGAVGTIKSDKKLSAKGLSFGDGDEDIGEFSKKQVSKVKPETKGLSSHTFGTSTGKSTAPAAKGSYYTNTSYSNDELAALTKNAKSLGAGTIIRVPANSSGDFMGFDLLSWETRRQHQL